MEQVDDPSPSASSSSKDLDGEPLVNLLPMEQVNDHSQTPFVDIRCRIQQVNTRIRVPSVSSDLVLKAFVGTSSLSPVYSYKNVQISFGGKTHSFDEVQDNGGMDCGAALRETSIQIRDPTTRWCTLKVSQLVEGSLVEKDQTVGVCHVKAGSPQIDCFTILNGIDSIQYPLLGRFILHDSSIRRYVGTLVPPTAMNSPGSFTVQSSINWSAILETFQNSDAGKALFTDVETHGMCGMKHFKSGTFDLALAEFQYVSVFGFFSHPRSEQYAIASNLAQGFEEYVEPGSPGPRLDIALAWARESQSFENSDDIKEMIERITKKMQV